MNPVSHTHIKRWGFVVLMKLAAAPLVGIFATLRQSVGVFRPRASGRRFSSVQGAVKGRRAMSWIGVRELGYSGADVARYLGVTNSCVTRMISTGKKPDIDDINLEL